MGFSPTPALSALLHVPAHHFTRALIGLTKKGLVKQWISVFQEQESSCFCLICKLPFLIRCTEYLSTTLQLSSFIGCFPHFFSVGDNRIQI
jgi:hypothetical protein